MIPLNINHLKFSIIYIHTYESNNSRFSSKKIKLVKTDQEHLYVYILLSYLRNVKSMTSPIRLLISYIFFVPCLCLFHFFIPFIRLSIHISVKATFYIFRNFSTPSYYSSYISTFIHPRFT